MRSIKLKKQINIYITPGKNAWWIKKLTGAEKAAKPIADLIKQNTEKL